LAHGARRTGRPALERHVCRARKRLLNRRASGK
jgi:hypothetical protein